MKYYLSIDQGTTSTRLFLFQATDLTLCHTFKRQHHQHLGPSGQVEHDAQEIWQQIEEMLQEVTPYAAEIAGIGITNQRETFLLFDEQGQPLTRAIVWQDKRTSSWCREQQQAFQQIQGEDITGLPLDPYFSASKLRWLIDHEWDVLQQKKPNKILFGTMDTFLLYKLTQGRIHATDVTNASRTQLMNLASQQWDPVMKKFFLGTQDTSIQWPQIFPSLHDFGTTSLGGHKIPITCLLGDQQAALIGSGALEVGQAKMTFGTGAFYLQNVGTDLPKRTPGLLRTIAYQGGQELQCPVHYALEGSLLAAGSLITWLKDQLELIADGPEINQWVGKIDPIADCKDQFFYPYLAGAGSPHWQPDWRGAWIGIGLASNKYHLCYLVLESLAFAVKELLQATDQQVMELRVDGGLANSDMLLKLLATVCQIKVIRDTTQVEATSLGAVIGSKSKNEERKLNIAMLREAKKIIFYPNENFAVIQESNQKWEKWIKYRKFLKK